MCNFHRYDRRRAQPEWRREVRALCDMNCGYMPPLRPLLSFPEPAVKTAPEVGSYQWDVIRQCTMFIPSQSRLLGYCRHNLKEYWHGHFTKMWVVLSLQEIGLEKKHMCTPSKKKPEVVGIFSASTSTASSGTNTRQDFSRKAEATSQ